MLKRLNNNIKHEIKSQKLQDSKAKKLQRNSSLSNYRQINLNKENIHPNQNISYNQIQNQLIYRNKYYDLKQHMQNSQLDQYQDSTKIIHQIQHLIPITHSIPQTKEIDIKVTNRSLERCQVHPTTKLPHKANFLVCSQGSSDLLCCQQCSHMYKNKVSVDRISQSIIGGGITIRQYYKLLNNRLDNLEKTKSNLLEYDKQFRMISCQQINKHRKYYNQILEIIQNSMKNSQQIISKHFNHGCQIINNKCQQVNVEIEFFKKQLRKLVIFQQKKINGQHHIQIQFDFKRTLHNFPTQIQLPIISIYTQIPSLRSNFQTTFAEKYAIKLLTQQQQSKISHQKQQENLRNTQRHSGHYQSSQSYQTTCQRQQQADLFCDEEFGEGKTNKTHQFSFDQGNEGDNFKNQCILEQMEEEEVISPVFKAI